MKIIFLDIDGVFNSFDWWRRRGPHELIPGKSEWFSRQYHNLDPDAVLRLNRIIRETGAKIVLSSTWRITSPEKVPERLHNVRQLFEMRSLSAGEPFAGDFIDSTPMFRDRIRGREIQDWLDRNDVDSFVIIDDDSDMEHLMPHLVRTNFDTGLLDVHIADCVLKLKGHHHVY